MNAKLSWIPPMDARWVVRTVFFFLFIAALSVTAYLGRLPAWTQAFPHFDWAAHFLLLGGLGFCFHRLMRDRVVGFYGLTFPLGPMIVSSGSILDESLQVFSPNRSFSFADMAANLIGIWLFYVIYHYGIKRKTMV